MSSLARAVNRSPKTLPRVGVQRRVGLHAKSARSGPKIFEQILAAAKFSVEIAPKSVPPDDARPCRVSKRSPKTLPSVGVPRRVVSHAKSARFGLKFFEKFSRAAKFSV